jgi:YIF1
MQALLYLMGIPSAVPFLEVVAYAGYPFVHVCLSSLVGAAFGERAMHCCHLMAGARLAACADWQHTQSCC